MSRLKFYGPTPEYLESIDVAGKLIVVEGTDGVGRSTHVAFLRQWLEVNGYAVAETGWTRSKLVGKTIDEAKMGHTLSPLTYTLLYACDFADRLEKEIIPALRAGYIVLADRYVYTALVRSFVRGMERDWLAKLFGFAPLPDLVLYLRVDVATLARRVLLSSGIDYWEAGKDRSPDKDIYDAFADYQSRILAEFDRIAGEFHFQVVDARQPIERVQELLRAPVRALLNGARKLD
ncbi:MAG: dTMP kinase [Phycisphaerae bacterium]